MLRSKAHTLKKLMSQPLWGLWKKINPMVCEFQHLLHVAIKIYRQCRCLLDNPLTDGLIFQPTPFLVPLTPCRYSSEFHCRASLHWDLFFLCYCSRPDVLKCLCSCISLHSISCSLCSSSGPVIDNKWCRVVSSHSWPSQSSLSSGESAPGQRHKICLPQKVSQMHVPVVNKFPHFSGLSAWQIPFWKTGCLSKEQICRVLVTAWLWG